MGFNQNLGPSLCLRCDLLLCLRQLAVPLSEIKGMFQQAENRRGATQHRKKGPLFPHSHTARTDDALCIPTDVSLQPLWVTCRDAPTSVRVCPLRQLSGDSSSGFQPHVATHGLVSKPHDPAVTRTTRGLAQAGVRLSGCDAACAAAPRLSSCSLRFQPCGGSSPPIPLVPEDFGFSSANLWIPYNIRYSCCDLRQGIVPRVILDY